MKEILETSLYASLTAQWSTLGINAFALFQKLLPKDQILQTVLWIETIVQVIELAFYSWYAYFFDTVAEMTFYRYHDWFVTTPLMLFSTMVYYDYRNKTEEVVTLESFLREHWKEVLIVFGFNALMLYFGYLYERNLVGLAASQVFGFIGFLGSFYVIWDRFVGTNPSNLLLFGFMFIVWGMYGVAAMFPTIAKNVAYNILDVIAKNFYGVFLSILIVQKTNSVLSDNIPSVPK
jgi:bacteriorhodopsin